MLSLFVVAGAAFVPPSGIVSVQRVAVSPVAEVTTKAKPLSPGSNYPGTKNIQTQSNGFGTFLQRFQTVSGKSKYGMPIFLPNGNINPAYLAAERKEMAEKKRKNTT